MSDYFEKSSQRFNLVSISGEKLGGLVVRLKPSTKWDGRTLGICSKKKTTRGHRAKDRKTNILFARKLGLRHNFKRLFRHYS